MKPTFSLRHFLCIAGGSLLAASTTHATTYTWANSNVTGLTPAATLDWLTGGPNTQGTWTGGTPVSSNTNEIKFFQDITTALTNTGGTGNTQTANINNGGSAFQLGTLTLAGKASATSGANLTMNISGDALNFSGATGIINLDGVNNSRTLTYNVNSNIQLGTASSASALTVTGAGTGTFNINGIISELQAGGGSLIKNGNSNLILNGTSANTYTGGTTLSAGTISMRHGGALGTGQLSVTGNSTLAQVGTSTTISVANAIDVANGITLTLAIPSAANSMTFGGQLTGSGTISSTTGSNTIYTLSNTGNTFTGNLTLGGGNTAVVNSIGDGGLVDLNGGTFRLGSSASATTLSTRQFRMTGTTGAATIDNDGTGALTINTNLAITGTGNKTLTLQGGTTGFVNTFAGNIPSGPAGSVIALTKGEAGTWAITGNLSNTGLVTASGGGIASPGTAGLLKLSGTNTNTGGYSVSGNGTLVFQGSQSLYTGNAISLNHGGGSNNGSYLRLLDDAAGTVSLNNTINLDTSNATGSQTIFVGNNSTTNLGTSSGTTTGSIIEVATLNFSSVAGGTGTSSIVAGITGANGYRLKINNVILNNLVAENAGVTTSMGFNPTTANVTIGNITMATGNTGIANDGVPTLLLGGTSSDNQITGTISNASDYLTGQALGVLKNSAATWTLSGSSTYTGATSITAGTLSLTGSLTGGGAVSTSGTGLLNQGSSGVISGASTLTQGSSVTSILAGANTYTGTTTITGGVLRLDNASALGGGNLTLNGGVLGLGAANLSRADGTGAGQYQFGASGGGFAAYGANRTVTLGTQNWGTTGLQGTLLLSAADSDATIIMASNLSFAGSARTIQVADGSASVDAQLNGVVSGGGTFNKTGTGTLRLNNGNNSYTAVTSVNAASGVLEVTSLDNGGSNSSIGASTNTAANLLLGNNTTLRYIGSGDSSDRNFTINGTAAGNQATLDASGTGAISFTNTASPAYGTTNQTRTLNLTGTNTDANSLAANIANNGTATASVIKSGIGNWALSGTNAYTGGLAINGGTLTVNTATPLGASGTITFGGGTLRYGTVTTDFSSRLGTGVNQFSIDTNGQNVTFASQIVATANASTFTKLGTGTLTLNSVTSRYSGATTIGGGTLNANTIANANTDSSIGKPATSAAAGLIIAGGTLQHNAANVASTDRLFTIGGATGDTATLDSSATSATHVMSFTNTGALAFGNTNAHTLVLTGSNTGTNTFAPVLGDNTGTTSLTKTGAGTWVVSNTNTYSGATTITTGTLQLDGSTHASSTVGIGTAGTLTGTGTVNGNATLTGAGIINKSSGTIAGTLGVTGGNWNGAGTVTGLVTSSSGTFTIGSGANLTANGNLNVTGGTIAAGNSASTITGSVNYTSSSNSSFAGEIAGSGKTLIMNNSASTLTLGGNNSYTGATTVSAGTLRVSAAGNLNNTSAIDVDAGAKLVYNSSTALTVAPTLNGNTIADRAILGGTGTINAAVTLNNVGDTLSPGNSPGIQTFTPAQTWSSFSYDWEVNNFIDTTAGTDFDQITLGSTLNLSGGSGSYILNLLGLTAGDISGLVPDFSEINRSWTILTSAGTLSGFNAADWTINTSGFTNPNTGTWSLDQSGNDLVLSYTVVPEPNIPALLGGFGIMALLRRRR